MKKITEAEVYNLLNELGTPKNVKGYTYIKEAVQIYKPLKPIRTSCLEVIAINNNDTLSRVERAIRHAIYLMMCKGNLDMIFKLFGRSSDITLSEFVATLSEHLRMRGNE
jgi:hypothetical protein